MLNKLLCATDGSKASEQAVDFAIQFAKHIDAELIFITVDTITEDSVSHSRFWNAEILEATNAQTSRELHSAETKAKASGLENFSCVAAHGVKIASTIIDYAEEHGADHIITGSTGKTGVSRALMGSISSDVVALAHCPVTVVR